MKDRIDAILQPAQAEYLDSLIQDRDPLLERMEKFAHENQHPIADPEVAQILRQLTRISRPTRILEIGTNIGYSVIVMGRECGAESIIETIELNPEIVAIAGRFVAEASLPCQVKFHQGAALDVLPTLDGPFDLVFIDCVKTEYGLYLDALEGKLRPGSILVCDNLLWKGQVAEGPMSPDQIASTTALGLFNNRISTDPLLLTSILPLGDGLGITVVIQGDDGRESGVTLAAR